MVSFEYFVSSYIYRSRSNRSITSRSYERTSPSPWIHRSWERLVYSTNLGRITTTTVPFFADVTHLLRADRSMENPSMTWWERKMTKAQEGMIMTMTAENWLELELVRGLSGQSLQKRILQERNPTLREMVSIATLWQSTEDTIAQFIVDFESSETDSESEGEANNETPKWNKGPVTSNLDYTCSQKEKEGNTHTNGNQRGKDDTPTDTSTSGDDGLVRRTYNYTSGKPLDRRPKMHNVRITPVTNDYRHNFLQFSSELYPDTGCMETVIARNMVNRQKMSVTPINRQLQCAEARQWRGSTTFDIKYHGRTSRVEALLLSSLEDGIFLGWTTLKDLISGLDHGLPYSDNLIPTITELRRDILGPEISHNHANIIRPEGLRRRQEHKAYRPNKPCEGCGDETSHHNREDCPNRGKRCYNCNRIGHVREVCRQKPSATRDEYQKDTIKERMLADLTYQLQDPVWRNKSDQKLIDLTLQLRDSIWKTKGDTNHA